MLFVSLLLSWWALVLGLGLLVVSYAWTYYVTHAALRGIPAPWPAQLTSLWLVRACRRGKRYAAVDEVHRRLGPVVRIQPNHVSVADETAIGVIYGHGNGDFYDAFVSIRRGLFNTRNRAEHTRKRKLISHTFSPRSVSQFEPYIRASLAVFVRQLDRLIDESEYRENDSNDPAARKEARFDCLPWFNYLAFDIIGDLAFGAPFGMLAAGADLAEVRCGGEEEGGGGGGRQTDGGSVQYASAIEILNRRGEVSATLGCLPLALRPLTRWLPDPFFRRGLAAVESLAGIAIVRVQRRLKEQHEKEKGEGEEEEDEGRGAGTGTGTGTTRQDLLARLQQGRDDAGNPLGREELTAEALTQLIAGSDTTSNSSCALVNFVGRRPEVLARLQAELDAAMMSEPESEAVYNENDKDDKDDDNMRIPRHDTLRDLPYLNSVIHETLRHHSTSGIGLPREILGGSEGVVLRGRHFPAGTVLSVPTYTVHHAREIWGEDAEEFVPERWGAERLTARQKAAFIPFSMGPRACVGRNLAEMEMRLIAATWAARYWVSVAQDGPMDTVEGFLRKPTGLRIRMRRRTGTGTGTGRS